MDHTLDPDRVRELTRWTIETWWEVKILTDGAEAAEEPSKEQIDLEFMVLTMDAGDPERLAKTAASPVAAAGKLLLVHTQALLASLPDANS